MSTYFVTDATGSAGGLPADRPAPRHVGSSPPPLVPGPPPHVFSRVAASEITAGGATFTSVRIPLVRTPLIGPTKVYDALPAATPGRASPDRALPGAAR